MIIRIYYRQLGGHVHCRVFTGVAKNMTFAKSGDLVFSEGEWDAVRNVLNSACEFVPEPIRSAIELEEALYE